MFLPGLLGGVALPMLCSSVGQSRLQEYQKILWTSVKTTLVAALLLAAPIAALAPWIMASYGNGFREGKWALVTLCASAVLSAVYGIIRQSIVSVGRIWTMFSLNLVWATVLLVCAWIFRLHGANGLAFSYLMADGGRLVAAVVIDKAYVGRGVQFLGSGRVTRDSQVSSRGRSVV